MDVWEVLGVSEWNSWKFEALGFVWGMTWVLSPCNMEPKDYLGVALKDMTFVHLSILRHQNIKMSIYKVNKNHWVI